MRLLATLILSAVVGCDHAAEPPGGATPPSVDAQPPERSTDDFLPVGPHGIGLRTYTFVDESRPTPANGILYPGAPNRTLVVNVWYPATSDPAKGVVNDAPLDSNGGPYPLILHSHGFMDDRNGESYIGEHLASHGYVVAAPDYPLSRSGAPGGATRDDLPAQPLDARFVIDRLIAESAAAGRSLTGAVDPTKIGVSGLSLGGLTSLLVAFHPTLRDPRIGAALPIAAPSCFFTQSFYATAQVPLLLLHGDSDLLDPMEENSQRAFTLAQGPRELVVLRRGSHTAFSKMSLLLPEALHYDRVGCLAVQQTNRDYLPALGTQGISTDPSRCSPICQGTPVDPSLRASRQQDLTRVVANAFFDATLKGDAGAAIFLTGRLGDENPEIAITLP